MHQIYVRMAEKMPEVFAFNLADYYIDTEGSGYSYRILLIVNIAEHRFVIKSYGSVNNLVGMGTAGYDDEGNYYDGKSAMRIIDPGNAVNVAETFCIDNSASATLASTPENCDAMRTTFLDATSGAWPSVSEFLALTAEDEDALSGYAELFDSGEMLQDSEVASSYSDGFPVSVAAK